MLPHPAVPRNPAGAARGLPGRLPGPASDVEDVLAETDAARAAQHFVMPPQFGVVAAWAWALRVTGVHDFVHGSVLDCRRLSEWFTASTVISSTSSPR